MESHPVAPIHGNPTNPPTQSPVHPPPTTIPPTTATFHSEPLDPKSA